MPTRRGKAVRKRARKRSKVSGARRRAFVPSPQPRVLPEEVTLVSGRSRALKKEGQRLYWHVRYRGATVGHAFIDVVLDKNGRPDPSITVELNERSRGRGIGSIAFRKACQASGFAEVYASIAKKNIASQIAVKRAGFELLAEEDHGGLTMVWRNGTDKK